MDALGWLAFLEEIADAADPLALRHFRQERLKVEEKADRSPVSEADLAIEEAARDLCAQRHPSLGIFGEEQGETGSAELRLIIDPIDATRNFVRGVPIFASLLAIEEAGEIVAGLVSAPALGFRWSAARGNGSFGNGQRRTVSSVDDLSRAQLFHGSLGGAELPNALPGLQTLIGETHRQRGFGDFYQHVLVADGAGEVSIDPFVSPWDIAPLQILVEEAGGRATSLTGERSIYAGSLVSSNGVLHDQVLRILAT